MPPAGSAGKNFMQSIAPLQQGHDLARGDRAGQERRPARLGVRQQTFGCAGADHEARAGPLGRPVLLGVEHRAGADHGAFDLAIDRSYHLQRRWQCAA